MYKLGLNFEHVIKISSELGVSTIEALKKVKMYGVTTLDVAIERIFNRNEYFSDIICSGLTIDSVYCKGDYGYSDNIGYELSIIDFCSENNINNLMLITNPILHGEDEAEYNAKLKKNLRRIVKYASNFNVKVSIENFGLNDSPFSTVKKLFLILKSVNGLKLTFDCGNFLSVNENPLDAFNALSDYVCKIHIKDGTVYNDGSNKVDFTSVGRGEANVKEIVTQVKNSTNNFSFTLEFDFNKEKVFDDVVSSATYYFTEIN